MNDRIADQLRFITDTPDEFDELATTFNSNATTIAALEWALGADTIKVTNGR